MRLSAGPKETDQPGIVLVDINQHDRRLGNFVAAIQHRFDFAQLDTMATDFNLAVRAT